YSGDSVYVGSVGAVEPLTIGMADTSTSTVIELNGTETPATTVALGTNVQDDATVTSSSSGAPITGTVTYTFYKETGAQAGLQTSGPNADTVVHTDTKSVGTDSDPTGALQAGTYYYVTHYSGDNNYNPSDGLVETLTVNKADTSTVTAIELNGTETE